jgi:extracellular elastinolytic metalloproteinase
MENDSTTGGRRTGPVRAAALVIAVGMLAVTGAAWGQNTTTFDDRAELGQGGFAAIPQMPALEALDAELGGRLTYGLNEFTGATTGLRSVDGQPIGSAEGTDPAAIARNFALAQTAALGLEAADLAPDVLAVDRIEHKSFANTNWGPEVRNVEYTHVHFRQSWRGTPVYGASLHVTLRGNHVLQVHSGLVGQLEQKATRAALNAKLASGPVEIASKIADSLGIDLGGVPELASRSFDPRQTTELVSPGLDGPMTLYSTYLPEAGGLRLEQGFRLETADGLNMLTGVAARDSGDVIAAINDVNYDSYRVYAQPCENPFVCARTLVQDPAEGTASPNGWHSSTLMQGNNANAYHDRDNNNQPPGTRPSCGSGLNCDFPINLSQAPINYSDAAVANLFYWNNVVHDIQYQYGFDEQAGNFQENNFGRGGAGSDSVNAEAQDGGGTNNANFATPGDGGNPRMQMYIWTATNPDRDGDLDNGIIIHEYGHGVSIRQIGSPNQNCLGGQQQPGEGYSDLLTVIYTAEASHTGGTARGVGGYASNSNGIRPQPYSTNPSVNNATYQTLRSGVSVPHGVGWVWASIFWEAYWELVDLHGFSTTLLTPGSAGNERALLYFNEGLNFTDCGGNIVNFVDARDGVLQAAGQFFGGEDVCPLWEAFARRGLGENANATNTNSQATNGFNVPSFCDDDPPPPPPPPPPGECLHEAVFGDAGGWIQGNSSCSTGHFVVGSPTLVTNGGVTTQPAGGAEGTTNGFFTAPNSSAGIDDVDGGTCEALSPLIDASGESAVEISLFYFHGQRDAGGDPSDGFTIEVLNNGQVVDTLVDIGDVTSNAAWTPVSTTISNPGNVQIRVRATDGTASGDLVEGGIDSVLVCPSDDPPPPGDCVVDDSFENGAAGWSNAAASTCSTGSYVLGTPTLVTNGGVTTQVGGARTGANAIFTATNSSAGVNDVDGGNCILGSPTWSVPETSTLEVWAFHGQRDTGGDANGDFFRVEVSTNGGQSFQTIGSNGDTTSNAAWTPLSTTIPAGSQVQLRVQCSDGPASGDLVECGIDDLSICN